MRPALEPGRWCDRRSCMNLRTLAAVIVVGVAAASVTGGCGSTGRTVSAADSTTPTTAAVRASSNESTRRDAGGTARHASLPACDALRCGPPTPSVPCPTHQTVPSFNGSYCGPQPIAGNGLGPSGECTGRESVPPCGPGMVVGRYYAYTLPGRCDGRLILNGRHWISELPPPTPVPDMDVWVSVGPGDRHAGFISPNGAVGFDLDHGQATPVCSKPPSPVPLPAASPTT